MNVRIKKRKEIRTLTTKMGGEADHLAGRKQVRLRQLCVIYHSPHLDIIDNLSIELDVFPELWIRNGFNEDPDPDFFFFIRIRIQGVKPMRLSVYEQIRNTSSTNRIIWKDKRKTKTGGTISLCLIKRFRFL